MEQLAKLVAAVLVLLLAVLVGGLWLLHVAINSGNFWQGVVAAILILFSGLTLLGAAFRS